MIAPPLTGRPFIGNPCAIGVPTPQSLGRPPQKFGISSSHSTRQRNAQQLFTKPF
jgi:hypothetical protein